MRWRILRIFGFGMLLLSLVGVLGVFRLWRLDGPIILRQMPDARLSYVHRTFKLEENSTVRHTPAQAAPGDPRDETQRMMDESMRWWDSLQPKRWEFYGITRGESYVPQTTYGPVGFPPAIRTAITTVRVEYLFIPPMLGLLLGYGFARIAKSRIAKAIKGRCPNCGYDLRATPDRCPECGTAMATSPPPIQS